MHRNIIFIQNNNYNQWDTSELWLETAYLNFTQNNSLKVCV